MTQRVNRKRRPAGDEGAGYTAVVMAEVKRLRAGKGWSAERLAEEMAAVAVPWTRDTVVNLETGRRKRLAAHELLGLAYVLETHSPVDLLAPLPPRPADPSYPVVPSLLVGGTVVRAWCEGKTGPLRPWLAELAESPENHGTTQAIRRAMQGQPESTISQVIALAMRLPADEGGES